MLAHRASGRGRRAAAPALWSTRGFVGFDLCVVPLDDAGRVAVQLSSPLIALGLLASTFGLHKLWQWANRRLESRAEGDGANASPSPLIPVSERLYSIVCIPTAARRGFRRSNLLSQRAVPLLPPPSVSFADGGADDSEQPEDMKPDVHAALAFSSSSSSSTSTLLWPLYQRSLVRLTLLLHTGLSLTCLSMFYWEDVGQWGARLKDYPTISHDSSDYRVFLPIVVVLLATVVCGVPLALFAFLVAEHRAGHIEAVKDGRRRTLVNLNDDRAMSWLERPRQQLTLQLTAWCRPRYWWMPAWLIVRRLVVIALITGVRDVSVWVWLTVVNYSGLVLHLKLEPFERTRDNQLDLLTGLSLALQTSLRALYPATDSAGLQVAFTTLVLAPLLPAVGMALKHAYVHYKGTAVRFNAKERLKQAAQFDSVFDSTVEDDERDQQL